MKEAGPVDDIEDTLTETLSSTRSVSTKVTHAALLKEKLAASESGGKCKVCKQKKEQEEQEEKGEYDGDGVGEEY